MRHRTVRFRFFLMGVPLFFPVVAQAMDLSWNGFGSTYYGQAMNRNLRPVGLDDTHVNFTEFSLFGLNLAAAINEDFTFAAQLVALGSPSGTTDKFGLMAQWAFANYQPTENTSVRVGRQLYPTLIASEYVRVGYLLPFRQIPYSSFATAPFTRFDGVSVNQKWATGFGDFKLGAFGGKPLLDIAVPASTGLAFNLSDLIGLVAELNGDGWRVHAQASRFLSELTMGTPLPASHLVGHTQSYTVGYRYDKHSLVSWSEFTFQTTPDGSPVNGGKYVGVGRAFYWLGGYRIGKFMPRYTYSQASNQFNILSATGYANGKETTHTLGLNYQAGSQAVIKVEYERIFIPAGHDGSYFVAETPTSTETSAGAFYAGVDFIF
jgi:hypothetical protein